MDVRGLCSILSTTWSKSTTIITTTQAPGEWTLSTKRCGKKNILVKDFNESLKWINLMNKYIITLHVFYIWKSENSTKESDVFLIINWTKCSHSLIRKYKMRHKWQKVLASWNLHKVFVSNLLLRKLFSLKTLFLVLICPVWSLVKLGFWVPA